MTAGCIYSYYKYIASGNGCFFFLNMYFQISISKLKKLKDLNGGIYYEEENDQGVNNYNIIIDS